MAALVADRLLFSGKLIADLASGGFQVETTADLLGRWAEDALGGTCKIRVEPPHVSASMEPILDPDLWTFPLSTDGRIVGRFEWRLPTSGATMATPTLVKAYVDAAATLLAQCVVVEATRNDALTDDLTGLGNRRRLEAALAELIAAERAQGAEFSMLLFDVDHFKNFNDAWGHEAGDRALRQAAALMRGVFRQEDVVCRYGGDEFAVILSDRRGVSDPAPRNPEAFAERLLAEAERQRISDERGEWLSNLSLSCGIATFPWDAGSARELLRAADAALFEAKRAGRNRIRLAGGRQRLATTGSA
jgi:diguanylate cyclase (GGDEF)-like protein